MQQMPSTDTQSQPDRRSRRRAWWAMSSLLMLAWIGGIAVAAIAVHSAPERSALDTTLDGVQQPVEALQPTDATFEAPAAEEPCWPIYGRGPGRNSNASDLRHGTPDRRTWSLRIGIMEFPPSFCDGVLYVNNQHGETFAIQARNRKVLWRRRTAKVYDSTPAVSGSRLFVGSFKPAGVQALDRATGKRLWRLVAGGAVESSPVVVDGIVYATSADRRVYAIDEETGKVRWAFRTGGEVKDSPTVANGLVYVANYAAEVFALDAKTGAVRWRRAVGGVRGDRIYSSVPVDGNFAYLATVRGTILALDARDGRTRWEQSIPGYVYSTPAIGHGRLFIGNYQGVVYAFNAQTGRPSWRERVGGTISGSPTIIGDLVYVSSLSNKRSFALSVRDGRRRWQHPDGRYVTGIATRDALYLSMGSMLTRWVTSPPAAR
jgi:outer membrane protein assembly factor BamB